LSADKRRLASFKAKIMAFPYTGLLAFGTTTGCGSPSGTIAARDALAPGNGTP
jgi:hypothetical protein